MAGEYATIRVEQELKLQPLRAGMRLLNAQQESPLNLKRTAIKSLPLAADSLKLDAQFFTFDNNVENDTDTLSNIKSYVSAATSILGNSASFEMSKTAVSQVSKQLQLHKISGTLVITASCTHRDARLLMPFYLDVDKAIRVWNRLFPSPQDKIRIDETVIAEIAEQEGTAEEKALNIISGCTLGSSFVGMVHILRKETTATSEQNTTSNVLRRQRVYQNNTAVVIRIATAKNNRICLSPAIRSPTFFAKPVM